MTADMLARRRADSLTVDPQSELGRFIHNHVQRDIRLIQIARVPKAKRYNPMFLDTHRLAVGMLTDGRTGELDGTIKVEAELMATALGVRERF